MYEHVKTGCKHIPPSEQPQFQSGYFLNKPHICNVEDKEQRVTCIVEVNKLKRSLKFIIYTLIYVESSQ